MLNLNDERGVTYAEALLTLFITFIILGGIPYSLKAIWIYSQHSPQKDVAVYQFYHFVEQDLYTTTSITILDEGVRLYKQDGDIIDIEQYGNIIRRRVNERGHQWLLQDVQSFQAQNTKDGFVLTLTREGGGFYQKRFNLYTK